MLIISRLIGVSDGFVVGLGDEDGFSDKLVIGLEDKLGVFDGFVVGPGDELGSIALSAVSPVLVEDCVAFPSKAKLRAVISNA